MPYMGVFKRSKSAFTAIIYKVQREHQTLKIGPKTSNKRNGKY